MKFSLTLGMLREATKEERIMLFSTTKKGSWEIERMLEDKVKYPETDMLYFNLDEFNKKDIPKLWSYANRVDVSDRTLNAIQRWSDAIKNPHNEVVPGLKAIPDMMKTVLRATDYKWMMKENDDGYFLPVLITDVTYSPGGRNSPPYASIAYRHAVYFDSDEYSSAEKHKMVNKNLYIHDSDLWAKEASNGTSGYDVEDMYDIGELDNEEEDEDDEDVTPKKKKKAPKKASSKKTRLPLFEILANEGFFMPTEKNLTDFFEHTRICKRVSEGMGKQYTCSGKASVMKGDAQYSYWRTRTFLPMIEEGVPFRLVVDMRGLPAGIERTHDTGYAGTQLIPYWPYIRLYNLTKYHYVSAHVASLVPYKYNKDIVKNVVMDKSMKNYLSSIMGGEEVYTDIVAGKSGGMIVLASGGPGLGKTLTAETYSETMERPLYQIQSSQLGIDIETIEKNLGDILRRAERWSAVLLIDECDTYVRKREKDIVQNCIVGVFLRLLEYFNGVMFLTTNMHDIIDEAILSRCTSHIRFKMPTNLQRKDMLHIHTRIQGVTLDDKQAMLIADKFEMSGRDIRNMIKNIKKVHHGQKGGIKLTLAMVEEIKDYIPFIK